MRKQHTRVIYEANDYICLAEYFKGCHNTLFVIYFVVVGN